MLRIQLNRKTLHECLGMVQGIKPTKQAQIIHLPVP